MSNAAEVEADENNVNVCGWCGVAEVDNIKLEDCDGCDLVKYCSDKCRGEHWHWHVGDCKNRAAELHDKELFTQPDISHRGECPLCFLPMPFEGGKCSFYSCCSTSICDGCVYAHLKNNGGERCPFCREPLVEDDGEDSKRMMKRVEANDPAATRQMGAICDGEGEYDKAFDYYTKAAELGDAAAHYNLGIMYRDGEGVEKDDERKVYHYEKAAIGGHPNARYSLGCVENENGNFDRSVKHFIIAATLGYEKSMKVLWTHYSAGNITKEDLEATLRTHQAALDEMKSPQREAAEAWRENQGA